MEFLAPATPALIDALAPVLHEDQWTVAQVIFSYGPGNAFVTVLGDLTCYIHIVKDCDRLAVLGTHTRPTEPPITEVTHRSLGKR